MSHIRHFKERILVYNPIDSSPQRWLLGEGSPKVACGLCLWNNTFHFLEDVILSWFNILINVYILKILLNYKKYHFHIVSGQYLKINILMMNNNRW